jgi:hypothetical protein
MSESIDIDDSDGGDSGHAAATTHEGSAGGVRRIGGGPTGSRPGRVTMNKHAPRAAPAAR